MSQLLVRGLDEKVVQRLKSRALANGRSLESEVRLILEQAQCYDYAEAKKIAKKWQKNLFDKRMTPVVDLLREDRLR